MKEVADHLKCLSTIVFSISKVGPPNMLKYCSSYAKQKFRTTYVTIGEQKFIWTHSLRYSVAQIEDP